MLWLTVTFFDEAFPYAFLYKHTTSTREPPQLLGGLSWSISPSLEVFYHLKKIPIHSEWYFVTIPHHWTAFLASRLQL